MSAKYIFACLNNLKTQHNIRIIYAENAYNASFILKNLLEEDYKLKTCSK